MHLQCLSFFLSFFFFADCHDFVVVVDNEHSRELLFLFLFFFFFNEFCASFCFVLLLLLCFDKSTETKKREKLMAS